MRRRESLFARGTDGVNWADAAQCLLDLHEARLFAQAEEFVQHFDAMHVGGRSPPISR